MSKEYEEEQWLERAQINRALSQANLFMWEYDMRRGCLMRQSIDSQGVECGSVIEGVPESLIESGVIQPESVDAYRAMYQRLWAGEPGASGDFWVKMEGQIDKWVERVNYMTIYDEEGKPCRAVGIGRDVTQEVENLQRLEERYRQELSYKKVIREDDLLVCLRVNITKNMIETVDISTLILTYYPIAGEFCNNFMKIKSNIPDLTQRKKFESLFHIDRIKHNFAHGKKTIKYEYQRTVKGGKVIWVATTMELLQQPESNDIVGFVYTHNINMRKVTQKMIDAVVEMDYDYVAYIDVDTEQFIIYTKGEKGAAVPTQKNVKFKVEVANFAQNHLIEEDIERNIKEMSLDYVKAELEKKKVATFYYRMHAYDDNMRYIKVQFSYIDNDKKALLLTRIDVTDIHNQERKNNEDLKNALIAAKQANQAKTEFFHE